MGKQQRDSVGPPLLGEAAAHRTDFDTTLAECRGELLGYLCQRLRNVDAAADLVQEAMLRMLKYRDAPEIQDYRLMLFRIANNLVIEFHRTRSRHHAAHHVSLSDVDPVYLDGHPVEAIVDARQAIDVLIKRTIVELPPRCRLVFMLTRFDGLTRSEVAEKMGISVKMVEKYITQALLACRAAVGDRDY